MNAVDVVEKPVEPKTEITNPVIKPTDLEISKSIFNAEKEKAKAASPEDKMIHQDVAQMKPRGRPKKVQEPPQEKSEEIPPVAEKQVDGASQTQTPSPSTSGPHTELPEDIFSPPDKKEESKLSAAVAELDAMKLPDGSKQESIASFAKLKESSKAHIAKLEAELADLRSRSGVNGDYEALKKQNAEWHTRYGELEERFGRELYAASPQFQTTFTEKEQSAISTAKSYLEGSEVEAGIVDMLVALPPAKRAQALAERGVDQYASSGILGELSMYDRLQRDKSRAIENWKNDVARSVDQQNAYQQEQESKRKEQEESVWKEAINGLDLIPLRKSKDEQWNTRGSQILERAKQMFNGSTDLKTLAINQIKGEAYDALDGVVKQLSEQLKEARTEVSKLKANKPGGEMTQSIPSKTEAQQHASMDRMESAKSIFNQFKQQAQGGGY